MLGAEGDARRVPRLCAVGWGPWCATAWNKQCCPRGGFQNDTACPKQWHTAIDGRSPSRGTRRRQERWIVKRRRYLPFGNALSEKMALPKDSQEHQDFRWEMCDGRLIGREGAVRYYLSVITGRDQFVAWDDQFIRDVREFVVSQTSKSAAQFIDDIWSIGNLASFFRRACERLEGTYDERKVKKRDKAIDLLLAHPEWTDEEIAARVPTTVKQLQRSTEFTGLRAVPKRRMARNAT